MKFYFCKEKPIDIENSITIYPLKYNNFWNETIFDLLINYNGNKHNFCSQIIFFSESKLETINSKSIVEKLLSSENHKEIEDFDFYFSLGTIEDYKNIYNIFNKEKANEILELMNDINYSKFVNNEFYQKNKSLFKNRIFARTFFRNDGCLMAFYKFEKIFSHKKISSICESIEFPEDNKIDKLIINFSENRINPNIFGIIGKNGIGKSHILKEIAKNNLSQDNFSKIIGVTTTTECDNTFSVLQNKTNSNTPFKHVHSNTFGDQNFPEIAYLLSRFNKDAFDRLIKFSNLFFDNEELYIEDNLRITPISQMINETELSTVDRLTYISKCKVCLSNRDDTATYRYLSSGEISCLKIIAGILYEIEEFSLVLIDEVENNFHPNYITKILYVISEITAHYKSRAVIATHSPYVIRELASSQVFALIKDKTNDKASPSEIRIKTLGANLQDLSNFIFGDEFYSLTAKKYFEKNNESIDKFEELSPRAASILKSK